MDPARVAALTPRQAQARFYELPRAFEAARARGARRAPLDAELFPPDASTERPYAYARALLAAQREAIADGRYAPAPGSAFLAPRADTPLLTRGTLVDRFIDDELSSTLHALRRAHAASPAAEPSRGLQVVDLGAGLATRPWALALDLDVDWFDLDAPEVLELKAELLAAAGAETAPPPVHVDLDDCAAAAAPRPRFPLGVRRYAPVAADLAAPGWTEALQAAGWDPARPTVFLAVALVYYMEGGAARRALGEAAAAARAAGAPAAWIGTVMNAAMVALVEAHQGAAAKAAAEAKEEAPGGGEPAERRGGGAAAASEGLRRGAAAAAGARFGVADGDAAALLTEAGWERAETVPWAVIERMFGALSVGLEYPPALRAATAAEHGHEPECVVVVARSGF